MVEKQVWSVKVFPFRKKTQALDLSAKVTDPLGPTLSPARKTEGTATRHSKRGTFLAGHELLLEALPHPTLS